MKTITAASALVATLMSLGGCGDDDSLGPDASVSADAGFIADGQSLDASRDGDSTFPLAGFGDINGDCAVINAPEIATTMPLLFRNAISFPREWIEANDLALLSAGGQEVITDGNAGGSSVYSEAYSFEVLYRCELATLLKTENEVDYNTLSKKTDFLVDIDTHKIGVSVTRAVKFPFGSPYALTDAMTLLDGKLSDILLSSESVSAGDAWDKQILHVLAYDAQHADMLEQALPTISAMNRADTVVWITVTNGADMFIY